MHGRRPSFRARVVRLADGPARAGGHAVWLDPFRRPDGIEAEPLDHLAPGEALRAWRDRHPNLWTEFCRRYQLELEGRRETCERLARRARECGLIIHFATDRARPYADALERHIEGIECERRWVAGWVIGGYTRPVRETIEKAGGLWFERHKVWTMPDRESWQRIRSLLPAI